MSIYIIDTVCPKGHKELNKKIISLLPEYYNKIVVNSNGFYSKEDIGRFSCVNLGLIAFKTRMISIIITQLLNYLKIRFKIGDKVDDIKMFTTFENVSFIFAVFFFRRSKKVVFHHDNVDYLNIKYIRFFFRLYMNNITHIVFADFIKDRLIEVGVEEKKIFVLTHPIPETETIINENQSQKLFIGLGYASDSNVFREIIEYENKHKLLEENEINLIFRTKDFEYNSKNIKLINKHLSRAEYNNLFFEARGVFLFYPNTFKYRFSGALLDAFRNKKFVIGSNIPIVRYFNKLYPRMCFYFNSISELFDILISDKKVNDSEFRSFIQRHSDNQIKEEFELIMKSI